MKRMGWTDEVDWSGEWKKTKKQWAEYARAAKKKLIKGDPLIMKDILVMSFRDDLQDEQNIE